METGNKFFVPFKIAELAKSKGFDDPCIAVTWNDNYLSIGETDFVEIMERRDNKCIACPMFHQLIDWFMENHKLHINVSRNYDGWRYVITDFSMGNKAILSTPNRTIDYYAELTEAIEEAFTLIK